MLHFWCFFNTAPKVCQFVPFQRSVCFSWFICKRKKRWQWVKYVLWNISSSDLNFRFCWHKSFFVSYTLVARCLFLCVIKDSLRINCLKGTRILPGNERLSIFRLLYIYVQGYVKEPSRTKVIVWQNALCGVC